MLKNRNNPLPQVNKAGNMPRAKSTIGGANCGTSACITGSRTRQERLALGLLDGKNSAQRAASVGIA
jgi:hypothetical protein